MSISPGQRLKAAREARGISRTWVAYQLNLTTERLAALEEDDYADLPENAYLRGYWRSYAQLVGMNWEDVEAPDPPAAPWRELHDVREDDIRPGRQMLLAALVLALLLGALVWQWQRSLFAEPDWQPSSHRLILPAPPPAPNSLDTERASQ